MRKVYEGNEPYIFVSYAHCDAEPVMRCIDALQESGYRVWYDGGIEVGSEWPEYIGTHLANSACVMAFISEHFVASMNCRQELALSQELRKEQLNIYLSPTELPMGLRLQLGLHQAVFRERFHTEEDFLQELCRARILDSCRQPVAAAPDPIPVEEPTLTVHTDLQEQSSPAPAQVVTASDEPKNGFEELEEFVRANPLTFAPEPPEKPKAPRAADPPPVKTPEQRAAQAAFDKKCKAFGWRSSILELCYGPISLLLMYFMTPWTGFSWLLIPILFIVRLLCSILYRRFFRKLKKLPEENKPDLKMAKNTTISIFISFLISTVVSLIGGIFALRINLFFLVRLLIAIGLNLLPFLVSGCMNILMDE